MGGHNMARAISKSDLVTAFAEQSGLSKKDASHALDALDALTDTVVLLMKEGSTVALPNLVKLEPRPTPARTGRNPSTGEAMDIPAQTVPKASFFKTVKEQLNS